MFSLKHLRIKFEYKSFQTIKFNSRIFQRKISRLTFHIKFLDYLASIQWYNNINIIVWRLILMVIVYQWWNDKNMLENTLMMIPFQWLIVIIIDISIIYLIQSLVYLPLAIANVLASRLNDGYVLWFFILNFVSRCYSHSFVSDTKTHLYIYICVCVCVCIFLQGSFIRWETSSSWLLCIFRCNCFSFFLGVRKVNE